MSSFFESTIKSALEKGEQELLPAAKKFFGNVADKWVTRGSKVTSKLGPEGEFIVNGLNNFNENHRRLFGEYSAARDKLYRAVPGHVKDDIHQNYEEYFTGKKPITDPNLQQLINFDKMTNLSAYGKAHQAKIPIGPPNPDDWSRIWRQGTFEGKGRADAIEHLIKTGQAKDEKSADRLLNFLSGQSKGVKNHNLVSARKVDLPGYRKDILAPADSMQQKLKSIAFAETFGHDGAVLDSLLSGIQRRSYSEYKLADKYVDTFLKKQGANYRPFSSTEQGINSVLAARFLGLTSLKHLAKPINTVLYSRNLTAPAKALRDMMVDYGNANEFAIRSGAVMSDTLNQMRTMFDSEMGRTGSWVLKLTGFNAIERLNRVFAANVGKHLAEELVGDYTESKSPKIAERLAQLGIDAKRAEGGLSEQELLRAGQRTSDTTQFIYNVNQLPMAWRDHPLSRMLTQYKPFIYMQSNFLKDNVIKPALQGDVRPLMYFSLLFPTVGEVVVDLSNLASKGDLNDRPDPKFIIDRVVDNISYIGGFGMAHDLMYAYSTPGDSALWHLFAGPLLSEAVDLLELPKTQHPMEGLVSHVPIVGRLASHEMRQRPRKPPSPHSLRGGVLTHGIEKILNE